MVFSFEHYNKNNDLFLSQTSQPIRKRSTPIATCEGVTIGYRERPCSEVVATPSLGVELVVQFSIQHTYI